MSLESHICLFTFWSLTYHPGVAKHCLAASGESLCHFEGSIEAVKESYYLNT